MNRPNTYTATSMGIAGQTSCFNTYDYSICFNEYPYAFYDIRTYDNKISLAFDKVLMHDGNGRAYIYVTPILGKWTHIAIVSSTSQSSKLEYKLYVNGELKHVMDESDITNWPNPALSVNTFTIGCASNGVVIELSKGNAFFGDALLYNRKLLQQEIINNYKFSLSNYPGDSMSTSLVNKIGYYTIGPTDISAGFKGHCTQLLLTRTWYYESWLYIPKAEYMYRVFYLYNNTGDNISVTFLNKKINVTGRYEHYSYYPINEWFHMLIQYDARELSVYINGTLMQ